MRAGKPVRPASALNWEAAMDEEDSSTDSSEEEEEEEEEGEVEGEEERGGASSSYAGERRGSPELHAHLSDDDGSDGTGAALSGEVTFRGAAGASASAASSSSSAAACFSGGPTRDEVRRTLAQLAELLPKHCQSGSSSGGGEGAEGDGEGSLRGSTAWILKSVDMSRGAWASNLCLTSSTSSLTAPHSPLPPHSPPHRSPSRRQAAASRSPTRSPPSCASSTARTTA